MRSAGDGLMRVSGIGIVAVVALLGASGAAGGPLADCYAQAENRLQVGPCLERRLAEAEEALQAAYAAGARELRELGEVTRSQAAFDAYRAAHEEFSRFREANCRWYGLRAEPGTGAGDFERDCLVRMTLARAAELEQAFATRAD